jgi:hypothetical protein
LLLLVGLGLFFDLAFEEFHPQARQKEQRGEGRLCGCVFERARLPCSRGAGLAGSVRHRGRRRVAALIPRALETMDNTDEH